MMKIESKIKDFSEKDLNIIIFILTQNEIL